MTFENKPPAPDNNVIIIHFIDEDKCDLIFSKSDIFCSIFLIFSL